MDTQKDFTGFYQENKALLKEYLENQVGILKLHTIKVTSRVVGLVVVIIMVGILGLMTMLFLGFSFAWWLSDKTGSNIAGFAGAAALFFVFMVFSIIFRKFLFQNPLTRLIIHESTRQHEELN